MRRASGERSSRSSKRISAVTPLRPCRRTRTSAPSARSSASSASARAPPAPRRGSGRPCVAALLAPAAAAAAALGLAHRPALGGRALGERAARRPGRATWRIARPWPSLSSPDSSSVEHLVGEVEQTDQVRDRGAAAADPARQLLLGDAEVLDQRRAGARLVDRVEVLADHVLDQRRLQALVLGRVADHRRDRLEAGLLGGAPAALAGDQLVAAVVERADDQRLEDARRRDRVRQRVERVRVEAVRGWSGLGSIMLDRQLAQLGPAGVASRAGSPPGRGPSPRLRSAIARPPRSAERAVGPASRRELGAWSARPGCRSSAPRRRGRCAGSPSRRPAPGSARAARARRPGRGGCARRAW